jgi:hypothetical protein
MEMMEVCPYFLCLCVVVLVEHWTIFIYIYIYFLTHFFLGDVYALELKVMYRLSLFLWPSLCGFVRCTPPVVTSSFSTTTHHNPLQTS